jgi:hypothetical protein
MSKDPPDEPEDRRPPNLRVVGKRAFRPMSVDLYDRLAEMYLHGERTIRGLARQGGVTFKIADRAIKHGWPRMKLAALSARAEVYDRQREHEAVKHATPAMQDEMGRWTAMREENLQLGRAIRAVAQRLLLKVNEAVAASTATRMYRRKRVVQVQVGKRTAERQVEEDISLPPYLPHLAGATKELSGLVSQMGAHEAFFAKITVPDHLRGASTGWDKLTDEELDHVIKNAGKLPPGVTIEMLRKRA